MKTVSVNLNAVDKVKRFVTIAGNIDGDLDLVSGRFRIDAKSIMGIFSLELSRPIELCINAKDENAAVEALKEFIV